MPILGSSIPEEGEMTKRKVFGAAFVALLAALGFTQAMLDRQALSQGDTVQAPVFEVDPLWPKPLPNHWLLGAAIGVWVDEQDHVWIIHRSSATLSEMERGAEVSPPTGECCRGAPPVLVFDQAGNLVRHWGGPGQGYEWPMSNHGIFVDHKGNVWIGGNGEKDPHLLKFTKDGKFVKEQWYARRSLREGSVWDIAFSKDAQQRYIFMADGRNQKVRIIVRETLEELTAFGDGGRQPGQFFGVHSIATDSKGNLYTTETYEGKRLQKFVYKGMGTVRKGSQGVVWPRS